MSFLEWLRLGPRGVTALLDSRADAAQAELAHLRSSAREDANAKARVEGELRAAEIALEEALRAPERDLAELRTLSSALERRQVALGRIDDAWAVFDRAMRDVFEGVSSSTSEVTP